MKTARPWLVARCCGLRYQRWATHSNSVCHVACARCGAALEYSRPAPGQAKREAQRAAYRAAGLTSRGTSPKRKPRPKTAAENQAAHQRRVRLRRRFSLTTPRKLSALESAWREFRAAMGETQPAD